MATITFTSDYANRKKGDVWERCPSTLASNLIRKHKVAKLGKQTTKAKSKKASK